MRDFFAKLNGLNDPHTYQSTTIGAEITTNGSIHHYLGVSPSQDSPAAYYQNGYTVFGMMGNVESLHSSYIYLFNHRTNELTQSYNWGTYPSGDYHSHPLPIFLPDGRILVNAESDHNTEFVVKRSLNPYDITEFETVATITDGDPAYNNMILSGDRVWMIFRNNLIDNAIRYSDDYGETWTTLNTILNLGSYADYWAYPKVVYHPDKLMFFCNRLDQTGASIYDKIFYLESIDGVNWSNKQGTKTINISGGEISAANLENYYLVADSAPNSSFITATCSWGDEPFFITQSPTSEDTLEFHYYSSGWQSKTITVTGVPLKDVNRLELLPTATDEFTLYAVNYDTFAASPNLQSRIVKITTTDAFDTNSHEFLTDVDNDYSLIAAHNFRDSQKTAVVCLALDVRGSGSDVEPTGGNSNFRIVDVWN